MYVIYITYNRVKFYKKVIFYLYHKYNDYINKRGGQDMSKISEEVINSLSINLREIIKSISRDNVNIEEIRLRSLKPLIVNSNNKDYFYNTKLNKLDLNMNNPYIVSKDDIEQTFQIMCKYSIHSFIDDIKKGFYNS